MTTDTTLPLGQAGIAQPEATGAGSPAEGAGSLRVDTLSRRRLLQVAGAGAAGGALATRASWASARGIPSIQGEPIELTYWHGWTEQWTEMVQYVVDQFHQKQGRIRIKPEVVTWTGDGSDFLTKLTASIVAGKPPDIVTLFGSTAIPTLANDEAIVTLNDIEGYDDAAVQEWMNPSVYQLGKYQDKVYGLSYWAGANALIYNTDHFTAAGLDPKIGPATIADLDAFTEKLMVRDSSGSISRMGFSTNDLWLWGTIFGGSFYDPEAKKVTANDPNNVRALEWMQSYREKYDPKKMAEFETGLASERAQNLDPLIAGKFSMQIQGPWKLGDIRKFADPTFKYAVVAPPRETADAPSGNWTWGDIQLIPQGSKDASAAVEFVKFTAGVGDPEGYAQRVVWGNRPINIPVSLSVLEVPSFQQVVKDYPGFEVFINSLLKADRIGSPPVMPAAAFYSDRMTATVERALLLETEAQPALDKLTDDVQQELDRSA